jgi:hypothetical protein
MKNGLLRSAETLMKQAIEYGEPSVQIVLLAGFRCLENAYINDRSVRLLEEMNWIRRWLVFPQSLSERQKDVLTGTTRFDGSDEEQPGWEPLLGATLQRENPYRPTMASVTRRFAFILRIRDHPENYKNSVERSVFRFGFFLAQLLCWQGAQWKNMTRQLRQATQDIALLNDEKWSDNLKGNV